MTTEQMLDGMLTHPILTAHNARGGMPPWRFQWRWWQSILIIGILCATGQLSLVDTVTAAQSNERPLAGLRLLHQWLVKSSPVSFKGVQALTIFHSKVTEVWRWRLWRDSSGKTRVEVIAPERLRGAIIIDDGRVRWHIIPMIRRIIKTPSISRSPWDIAPDRLNLLAQNYNISISGEDIVAGRKCHIVDITPHQKGNPSQRLWLDARYFLPLRIERKNPYGKLLWRMEYHRIAFTATMPKKLFIPEPPKEWRVVEFPPHRRGPFKLAELPLDLGFDPAVPIWLPPGYVFEAAFVINLPRSNKRALQLIYTDGMCVISIFEHTIGKRPPRRYRPPHGPPPKPHLRLRGPRMPQHVVRKRIGKLQIVLISQISMEWLRRVADSIVGANP